MPPSFPPRRSSELRLLDESVTYARQRSQFGRPIGEFQLVQAMLADSQAELYAGWSMAQDCARRYDNKPAGQSDPDASIRAPCPQLFCTEIARASCRESVCQQV